MTLHALRLRVGDEVFFTILGTWTERFHDGNATTEDFTALAEEISGVHLDAFFQSWLFESGLPKLPSARDVRAGISIPIADSWLASHPSRSELGGRHRAAGVISRSM